MTGGLAREMLLELDEHFDAPTAADTSVVARNAKEVAIPNRSIFCVTPQRSIFLNGRYIVSPQKD